MYVFCSITLNDISIDTGLNERPFAIPESHGGMRVRPRNSQLFLLDIEFRLLYSSHKVIVYPRQKIVSFTCPSPDLNRRSR